MTNISKIGQQTTCNIMRLFKKRLVSSEEIGAILTHLPEKERYLGAMPKDWFSSSMTHDEISKKSYEVFGIFSDFAQNAYSNINTHPATFIYAANSFSEKLTMALEKVVKLKYFAQGFYGKVFKLKVGKKNYALKIFHDKAPSAVHGKSQEIANVINYNHATKPSVRSKFYFGKIAGQKDKDGFILTEFVNGIEKRIADSSDAFQYKRFDLPDAENGLNKIKGKLIDYGNIILNFSNKKAARIAKELFPLMKKGDIEKVKILAEKYKRTPELYEVVDEILWNYKNSGDVQLAYVEVPGYYTFDQREIIKYFSQADIF